jgi:hypothetical protein
MMTYTAPDGYVIESKPYPEVVKYDCPCQGIVDGVFYSVETTGADTQIGIQQIKIKRTVNNNYMSIEIQMSSDAELIEYINENTPPNLNF